MTPEEIVAIGVEMYGEAGWKKKLAKDLGVDYATVKRWAAGSFGISPPVALAIECLRDRMKTHHDPERRKAK